MHFQRWVQPACGAVRPAAPAPAPPRTGRPSPARPRGQVPLRKGVHSGTHSENFGNSNNIKPSGGKQNKPAEHWEGLKALSRAMKRALCASAKTHCGWQRMGTFVFPSRPREMLVAANHLLFAPALTPAPSNNETLIEGFGGFFSSSKDSEVFIMAHETFPAWTGSPELFLSGGGAGNIWALPTTVVTSVRRAGGHMWVGTPHAARG